MLFEIGSQARDMLIQFTRLTFVVKLFEPFDAPILVLAKILGQRRSALDSAQSLNFLMLQSLTLEVEHFHFPLYLRMGMVVALVIEFVDGLGGEC